MVVAVDPGGKRATIDRGGCREILDLDQERHWDYGYVQTVHAAQGRTADRALLHIDGEQLAGCESFYVGLSRAQSSVSIFTDDASALPNTIRREMAKATAVEFVVGACTAHAFGQPPRSGAVAVICSNRRALNLDTPFHV